MNSQLFCLNVRGGTLTCKVGIFFFDSNTVEVGKRSMPGKRMKEKIIISVLCGIVIMLGVMNAGTGPEIGRAHV